MVCLRGAHAGGRLVAILTFTSFVMLGQKGDRPTEQSSSFIQGKRMIGGICNVLLSRFILKLKMVKIHWFLW